jgi:hypothetical protein
MNLSSGGATTQRLLVEAIFFCGFRCAAATPREKSLNEPEEYKIACVELLAT